MKGNKLSEILGRVTKHLTETILNLDSKDSDLVAVKDLDSITKYNGKVSMICDETESNRTHLVWTRQRAEQLFLETILQPGIVYIGIQELECSTPQLDCPWSGTNGSML